MSIGKASGSSTPCAFYRDYTTAMISALIIKISQMVSDSKKERFHILLDTCSKGPTNA